MRPNYQQTEMKSGRAWIIQHTTVYWWENNSSRGQTRNTTNQFTIKMIHFFSPAVISERIFIRLRHLYAMINSPRHYFPCKCDRWFIARRCWANGKEKWLNRSGYLWRDLFTIPFTPSEKVEMVQNMNFKSNCIDLRCQMSFAPYQKKRLL